MKLPTYRNHRAGTEVAGFLEGNTLDLWPLRGFERADPDALPGDILELTSDAAQKFFVKSTDLSHMGLTPKRRHLPATVQRITGSATVRRQSSEVNAFGRQSAPSLEIVADGSPAALIESREIVADGSPAGAEVLVLRHVLLIRSDSQPKRGDQITYEASGAVLELEVIGAFPVAGSLWKVHCTD